MAYAANSQTAPPPAWLDYLPEGCVVFDASLQVLYCNAAFASRYGHSAEELTGKELTSWLPDFIGSVLHSLCKRALHTRTSCEADEAIGRHYFQVRVHPMPEGVMAFVADVTPRRQMENELAESALRGSMLLGQLPTVHWAVDRELRFTLSEGAGLTALGLEAGEVVGRTLWEFFETRDPEHASIRQHLRALSGESVSYVDCHYGRCYQTNLEPLRDHQRRIIGVLGLALDVTEQQQAEEERARLQQQVATMQKSESLGVLAGGVAHDFNNMLVGILGAAELLLRELPENSPQREHVLLIRRAGERAADVTRQMLVFAGKSAPSRRPVDLNVLIRDNLPLLTSAFQGQLQVDTTLAHNLPPIDADPGQIQQVVMNLLLNAADALEGRPGRVRVTTTTQHIKTTTATPPLAGPALTPGWYVALEVSDDGCGMAEEVQARIFDPFFTTKPTGRGLGLSAVQGIVRGHQGRIVLESKLGVGTTFRVQLPLARIERSTPLPGALRPHARGTGTVLIVDDEAFIRDVGARVLRGAGYQTRTASNGREAIEALQRDPAGIHLVVLDLFMHGLDGWDTLRQLRAIRLDVPVVLTSGQPEEDVRARARAAQTLGYLAKPYTLDRFVTTIERALRGEQLS